MIGWRVGAEEEGGEAKGASESDCLVDWKSMSLKKAHVSYGKEIRTG